MDVMVHLGVLIVIGVILGNMFSNAHAKGTHAFFSGFGNLWGETINGMLVKGKS